MIEKGFTAAIERHATHGHGDHLGARRAMRGFHLFIRTVFSGADDQARVEDLVGYLELIG